MHDKWIIAVSVGASKTGVLKTAVSTAKCSLVWHIDVACVHTIERWCHGIPLGSLNLHIHKGMVVMEQMLVVEHSAYGKVNIVAGVVRVVDIQRIAVFGANAGVRNGYVLNVRNNDIGLSQWGVTYVHECTIFLHADPVVVVAPFCGYGTCPLYGVGDNHDIEIYISHAAVAFIASDIGITLFVVEGHTHEVGLACYPVGRGRRNFYALVRDFNELQDIVDRIAQIETNGRVVDMQGGIQLCFANNVHDWNLYGMVVFGLSDTHGRQLEALFRCFVV